MTPRFANRPAGWTDQLPEGELSEGLELAREADRVYRMRPEGFLGSLLEEFRRDGIFVAAGTAGRGQDDIPYLWVHRSLAEYLVARYLASQPREVWERAVEQHRWFDVDWVEPISLLGGTLRDRAGQLLEVLLNDPDDPFQNQLFLAARVIREASPGSINADLIQFVVQRLAWLMHTRSLGTAAVTALADSGDPQGRGTLRALLTDPRAGAGLRTAVARALGRSGDPQDAAALRAFLTDGQAAAGLGFQAAKVLALIGNPQDVATLLAVLADLRADPGLRTDVAAALGWIGDSESIRAITEDLILAARDSTLTEACYDSLAKLAPALRRMCSDREWAAWRKRCMPLAERVLQH